MPTGFIGILADSSEVAAGSLIIKKLDRKRLDQLPDYDFIFFHDPNKRLPSLGSSVEIWNGDQRILEKMVILNYGAINDMMAGGFRLSSKLQKKLIEDPFDILTPTMVKEVDQKWDFQDEIPSSDDDSVPDNWKDLIKSKGKKEKLSASAMHQISYEKPVARQGTSQAESKESFDRRYADLSPKKAPVKAAVSNVSLLNKDVSSTIKSIPKDSSRHSLQKRQDSGAKKWSPTKKDSVRKVSPNKNEKYSPKKRKRESTSPTFFKTKKSRAAHIQDLDSRSISPPPKALIENRAEVDKLGADRDMKNFLLNQRKQFNTNWMSETVSLS